METKYNEATPQRPAGDRVVDDTLVEIDLPAFMNKLKAESTWADSDRNAITVFKTDGLRMVLIGLHRDAEMPRHSADGIISVHVLEGNITFTSDGRTVNLGVGQVAALHKNIPHSVRADTDSFFLLTLTTTSEDKAVQDDWFGPAGTLPGSL